MQAPSLFPRRRADLTSRPEPVSEKSNLAHSECRQPGEARRNGARTATYALSVSGRKAGRCGGYGLFYAMLAMVDQRSPLIVTLLSPHGNMASTVNHRLQLNLAMYCRKE